MTPAQPPEPDPMPQAPPPPDLDDCCGSGCDPCVFDLHERAMERYRHALREWRARHPEATSAAE
jgi:oxidoreductase family protein